MARAASVYWRVISLACCIVPTSCVVTHDDDVTPAYTETTLTTTESNRSRDNLASLHPSESLVLFMGTEKSFDLQFNVLCKPDSEIIIAFRSKLESVFSIGGTDVFEIQCPSDVEDHSYTAENNGIYPNTSLGNMTDVMPYSNTTITLTLRGHKLGVSELYVSLWPSFEAFRSRNDSIYNQRDSKGSIDEQRDQSHQKVSELLMAEQLIPVLVLRNIRVFDRVFLAVVPVFIVIVMIGFGCKLDMEVVKECIKKPLAPGIGFGCQYLLMPLIGFTLAKLVPTGDPGITLGIFLCGICPGGGVSNIYTYLLDGDVSLSITMTFFSTLASIGMMPLWIYTLGRVFTEGRTSLTIPYLSILQTTAMVTVSLLIGIFIKYKCHRLAKLFIKMLKPITLVLVIVLVTVGIYSNLYVFKMFQPVHFLAGCLLPYCGYALGGVIAALCRLPWARVKTVAIETGLQNIGIAFIVLMHSFPPPYGDIAAIAPAASALMTPLPLLLVSIVYLIYKRCTRKYEEVEQNADTEKNGTINSGTDGNIVLTEKLSSV